VLAWTRVLVWIRTSIEPGAVQGRVVVDDVSDPVVDELRKVGNGDEL